MRSLNYVKVLTHVAISFWVRNEWFQNSSVEKKIPSKISFFSSKTLVRATCRYKSYLNFWGDLKKILCIPRSLSKFLSILAAQNWHSKSCEIENFNYLNFVFLIDEFLVSIITIFNTWWREKFICCLFFMSKIKY